MPFDADEIATLITEGRELGEALVEALRRDDDGKVRVTKAEMRGLGKRAGLFAVHALFAWLD